MSLKTPATVSAILTVALLILLALVSVLLQMVAVNGAAEKQGLTAMGISLACQSIVVLLLATLAARATHFLVTRVSWNGILAVAVTVLLATMIGGTLSFVSSVIAIPLAGIH
jgi:membrane protease YdiL (CAAX protease family)